MKSKALGLAVLAAAVSAATTAGAAELTVSITNLTRGMSFTPRLLVAHNENIDLFQAGEAPTDALAWMAEGGVIVTAQNPAAAGSSFGDVLETAINADNNVWQAFGLGGPPLPPATISNNYTFDSEDFEYLSLVTMLIPTNDAFAGLDSWRIPTEPGTYTVNLNAYDAGSEANDEISALRSDITEAGTGLALGGYGVPGMAGSGNPNATNVGTGGTGVAIQIQPDNTLADDPADREGLVHIHRNVLGDTDAAGGISDLDSRVHRWLNPVARLTITVN
ncbi:MAG: spondin domain-containing protein [Gammaproteobacteria bacterium]